MEQHGFILIADITGYTTYLSRSELEHAQGTLTDLLELLVEHTRPPLVISRLEGDAVISYTLRDGFASGQTFVESVEDTYVAFRRAIDLMVLNNTCRCNACANVSSLDLKFFVHYGSFAVQRIGDHDELLGSDVNLIHRLLKNHIKEKTGMTAYVLCTAAAEEALGLGGAATDMVKVTETVDDFGEVEVWVKDMHPVFEARKDERQVDLPAGEVITEFVAEIAAPPELVWDYLHHSDLRNVLMGSDRQEVIDRQDGRIGAGSAFQCFHGQKLMPQVVLDWRPFERVMLEQHIPLPGKPARLLMETRLEPTERGTRMTLSLGRPMGNGLQRAMIRTIMRMNASQGRRDMDAFRDAVEEDIARRVSPEPTERITPELITAAAAASLQESPEASPDIG